MFLDRIGTNYANILQQGLLKAHAEWAPFQTEANAWLELLRQSSEKPSLKNRFKGSCLGASRLRPIICIPLSPAEEIELEKQDAARLVEVEKRIKNFLENPNGIGKLKQAAYIASWIRSPTQAYDEICEAYDNKQRGIGKKHISGLENLISHISRLEQSHRFRDSIIKLFIAGGSVPYALELFSKIENADIAVFVLKGEILPKIKDSEFNDKMKDALETAIKKMYFKIRKPIFEILREKYIALGDQIRVSKMDKSLNPKTLPFFASFWKALGRGF